MVHNEGSAVLPVVHIFVDHVLLDLLLKEVIRVTLDPDIANYIDTNAAAKRFFKRLVTFS